MKITEKFKFDLNGLKLTYDDVLLSIEEATTIMSRKDIDLSVEIKNLKLNLPIFGANMSTVINSRSARYLSLMGGIGIIHQNMNIDEQIEEILKVKRYGSPFVYDPLCVSLDKKANDVIELFERNKIGAVLIVDKDNKLLGIVTKRDINARDSNNQPINQIMTKFDDIKYIRISNIESLDLNFADDYLKKSKVEQVPIINENGVVIGLFTSKGYSFYKKFKNSSRDKKLRLVVGAAVGQNRQPLKRIEKLISAGVDIIVVDTAHGRSKRFLDTIKEIRYNFKNVLIAAGNIDNKNAAKDMIEAGVDILKVGIGPGGACKTRIQTGFGKPQLSAIAEIKEYINDNNLNIMIIGDGGINTPGKLAKSIAAGANFGMIGSILAGTDLAPGEVREINGKLYKDFRGMASIYEANLAYGLRGIDVEDNDYGPIFDEGYNDIIPYKGEGSFINTLRLFHGGLSSALSYANSINLNEFYKKTRFEIQTLNGNIEGKPYTFTN